MTKAAWLGCLLAVAACGGTVVVNPGGSGDGGAGVGGSGTAGVNSGGAGNGAAIGAGGTTVGVGVGGAPGCTSDADCAGLSGPCALGVCISAACAIQPINELGSCDDGFYCKTNDVCMGGFCVGTSPLACPSTDACTIGVCDEAQQGCTVVPGNDGLPCDDFDPCTPSSFCKGGMCFGAAIDCSALDTDCAIGVCTSSGCTTTPINEGGGCDDGLFCSTGETCASGVCQGGQPISCAPPGGCFLSVCDESQHTCVTVVGNDGALCDDQNACTAGSICAAGNCVGGVPANEGMSCDDGNMCTNADTCTAGVCLGTSGTTTYFSEDFSDNSAGWILGPQWQIGSAKPSFGGVFGSDPPIDHTPTMDNGVAGVVIGGNAGTNLHPYFYLESPPFDTSGAGSAVFGFYRWLNSDYDPFMHNRVEVFNGAVWTVLWQSGPAPGVQDSPPQGLGWTYVQFDVTAFKSAGMKVRFGFDVASGGVYTIGSWNVDDVLVSSAPCP